MIYHKINGLYKRYREGENKGKFIIGDYSIPEFEYLVNNEWEWTEKFHGCLSADSRILLSDGKVKTIQEIVETKYKGEVLGLDNKGNLISSKIQNWFINGKTKNWLKIKYKRPTQRGNSYFTVTCTPNHKFYNPQKKKYYNASDLKVGDSVLCIKFLPIIPYHIKEILIGKMIGDGSLQKKAVCFGHKKEHKGYIDYILKSIGYLAGKYQPSVISGYGTEMLRARTKSCESIDSLFTNWFIQGKKQIPSIILSPISLAFWYMDDGSLTHTNKQEDRVYLATNGFNKVSINNLLKALSFMDIKGIKYKSNGWRIRINKNDSSKFFTLVSPYIPKCMQYKLPKIYRRLEPTTFPDFKLNQVAKQVVKKIIKIEPCLNYKNTKKYDIETKTHNFFVNNCLVHNSNCRVEIYTCPNYSVIEFKGKTDKADMSKELLEKLNSLFPKDKVFSIFKIGEDKPDVTLYGEAISHKINSGGKYFKEGKGYDFILFDIRVNNWWLKREDVANLANQLGIKCVPVVGKGDINEALNFIKQGFYSTYGNFLAEGIVIRPKVELKARNGNRVITKIKHTDFTEDIK